MKGAQGLEGGCGSRVHRITLKKIKVNLTPWLTTKTYDQG